MLAFQRAIEEGNEITVTGENISAFKMSSWWERAYGPTNPTVLTISPSPFDLRITLLLVAAGAQRSVTIPIELRQAKAGTKVTVLESEEADRSNPSPSNP